MMLDEADRMLQEDWSEDLKTILVGAGVAQDVQHQYLLLCAASAVMNDDNNHVKSKEVMELNRRENGPSLTHPWKLCWKGFERLTLSWQNVGTSMK